MSNRPYFKYTGVQIRQVFEDNQNNLEVLKLVFAELQYRSTPKMKVLRSKVEERIETLASCGRSTKTETSLKNDTLKHAPRQPQASKQEQNSLFDNDDKTQKETKKTIRSSTAKADAEDSSNNKKAKEEPVCEPRMGKMRKPGKLDGVPIKRQFDFKDDVKLEFRKDAPLVERYESGVKALVAEMRRKKTAFKQIVLRVVCG